jgi:hypothetical protein
VLPVVVEPTPMEEVPPYLTAGTVLQPKGNLEAAILDEVAKIAARRRAKKRWTYLGLGALVIAAILSAWWLIPPPAQAVCYLNAELRRPDGSTIPPNMMLDVTYAGSGETFLLSPDALATIKVGPFRKGDAQWTAALRNADGSVVGTEVFQGCSATAQERRIGDVFDLILSSRK